MNHLSLAVLSRALLIVAFVSFSIVEALSQKVIIDKTTDTYRKIITSETVWFGSAQAHKSSLCYYKYKDSISYFVMDVDWGVDGDINRKVEEGYCLLVKQQSGNLMEIECAGGREDIKSKIPFINAVRGIYLPVVDIKVHALYLFTEDQIVSLIKDPATKMRVEFINQYCDIECLKKNGISPFSEYLQKAYMAIKTARETTKTGLYDNF